MCLAIPGQITEINEQKAVVKYPKVTNFAYIGDEKVAIGDWVLVQMGIIVKKLDEKEAKTALESWTTS